MFSATVMSGRSAGCWWTIAIPRSCADRGREVLDGRAVEDDRAAVGCRRARGDVHQRRLAGAVLPEQGVHLAREHVERDVRERRDRVVVLGDAEHRQRRMHGGPALRGRRVDGGFVDHDERSASRRCARRPRAAARNPCVVPTSSPAWPARRPTTARRGRCHPAGWPCIPPDSACRSSSPRTRATGSACSPASCRRWRAPRPSRSRGARGRSASRR